MKVRRRRDKLEDRSKQRYIQRQKMTDKERKKENGRDTQRWKEIKRRRTKIDGGRIILLPKALKCTHVTVPPAFSTAFIAPADACDTSK